MVSFNVLFVVLAAVSAVGLIEWAKGFPALKAAPSWVWRLLLVPAAAAAGLAGGGGIPQEASDALLILAIAEICYPLLIQLPSALIQAARRSMGAGDPPRESSSVPAVSIPGFAPDKSQAADAGPEAGK